MARVGDPRRKHKDLLCLVIQPPPRATSTQKPAHEFKQAQLALTISKVQQELSTRAVAFRGSSTVSEKPNSKPIIASCKPARSRFFFSGFAISCIWSEFQRDASRYKSSASNGSNPARTLPARVQRIRCSNTGRQRRPAAYIHARTCRSGIPGADRGNPTMAEETARLGWDCYGSTCRHCDWRSRLG